MWKSTHSKLTRARAQRARRSADARATLADSKVRERRKMIRRIKSAFVLVLATLMVAGLSWVSYLDTFGVRDIVVDGTVELRDGAIQAEMMQATAAASLGLFSKQNVLLYPQKKLEAQLQYEFPRIEHVEITTEPTQQQVHVTIAEREPYATWCRGRDAARECYRIDRRGFVFERIARPDSSALIFDGGSTADVVLRTRIAPEYFVSLVNFIDDITARDLQVRAVHIRGTDATLTLAPSWDLKVALDKNLGATAFNLDAVLTEHGLASRIDELSYVDMRFDERVYYKLKE